MPANHTALLRQGDWDQSAMTRAACASTRLWSIQGTVSRANQELSGGVKKTIRLKIHFHCNMTATVEIGMHRTLEAYGKCTASLPAINDIILFDGVLPMLAELKARHHWLSVATGKSRKGLNEALHDVDLKGMFDASRTADETAGKPSPLMLHELMRELGVEPERTLMIGDTTHDLQMALNAGCASVGVSYGAHEPSAFQALQPRFVAHSVNELRSWLNDNA